MKIPESLKNVLSEADLADIKKEFDKQVQIQVESALHQYDDEAEKRILELVKQIDENHKVKLVNLLKKKDAKDKALLESIKAKYTEALRTDAEKFKASLAKNIERFIESKIGNIVDYSIIKEENLIITVGTMIHTGDFYNKGFDLFIQAAGRNPDLKFMLIGLNPDYLKWTEDNYHVSEFENLKIIPSFCPQDVLNESYNRAKIFVQASITEGMPNTLSEAMLLECIPVGSNINGIPDAIGDTGVVIRQRNVEDLETGIRHALKKETGLQARKRVIELFSFERRERELLRIFNGMVGKQ